MCFRNYRLWKSCLDHSPEALFQKTLWHSTCESLPKSCEISMRALLSCFFVILREVDLENVSLVLGELLVVFVKRLIADCKFPIRDCENLRLPIEIKFSEKGKTFSQFFVPFLVSTSNFKHFAKKDDCHS